MSIQTKMQSLRATFGALKSASGEDYRATKREKGRLAAARSVGGLALAGATTAVYMFGQEISMGATASQVYEQTDGNILAVAGASGGASLAAEVVMLGVTAWALKKQPHTTAAFAKARYSNKDIPLECPTKNTKASLGEITQTTIVGALAGTPGIMGESFLKEPDAPLATHTKRGAKTAGVLTAVGTGLGAAYAASLQAAPGSVTETILDYGTRMEVWVGAIVASTLAVKGMQAATRGIRSIVETQGTPQHTTVGDPFYAPKQVIGEPLLAPMTSPQTPLLPVSGLNWAVAS
jgi:hypothetical protein